MSHTARILADRAAELDARARTVEPVPRARDPMLAEMREGHRRELRAAADAMRIAASVVDAGEEE